MALNLQLPESQNLKPKITVFGVGGAGGNAVNNMVEANLQGVEFVAANTDSQALDHSKAQERIQLGEMLTRGLGAGASPEVGCAAAEEALSLIEGAFEGSNMVFIAAGMGGGTGTGAAPVIAKAARDRGILTVGVVTKPFHFEGGQRMKLAEMGLAEMQKYVDTMIVIPNQNLFRIATEQTTFADAFKMADEVLHQGVRGITDLMVMPGLINLDFADIRSVMGEMGKAMMGAGQAEGEGRAIKAAEAAISNPLLDNVSMKGARGVLINITGGMDMTLFEVDEAANRIRDEVDVDANIIFGSAFNPDIEGSLRVSVVATGIEAEMVQPMAPNQTEREVPVSKVDEVHERKVAQQKESLYVQRPSQSVEQPVFDTTQSQPFIAPRPATPSMQSAANIPSEADTRQTEKPLETEPMEVAQEAPERARGIFGRVASMARKFDDESERREPALDDSALVEETDDEIDNALLEVPAFLRRKPEEEPV